MFIRVDGKPQICMLVSIFSCVLNVVLDYEHLATEDTLYIECTIDDPSITDENNCMYELCQTISPEHPVLKENTEILTHSFEGGKYAVYHFKGFPQFLFTIHADTYS